MIDSPPSRGQVQSMKHIIPMRFRLTDEKAINLKKKQGNSLPKLLELKPSSPKQKKNALFQLKFCQQISADHILVGNEYQLNLINFSAVTPDFPDIACDWTLAFNQKITAVFIVHRLRKLFIACNKTLHCYGYRDDSIETPPIFYQTLTFKHSIDEIYVPKRDYLLVFAETQFTIFEMYNPHGIFQFKNIFTKQYRKNTELDFFCIPKENGLSFSVFLIDNQQNQQGVNEKKEKTTKKANKEKGNAKGIVNNKNEKQTQQEYSKNIPQKNLAADVFENKQNSEINDKQKQQLKQSRNWEDFNDGKEYFEQKLTNKQSQIEENANEQNKKNDFQRKLFEITKQKRTILNIFTIKITFNSPNSVIIEPMQKFYQFSIKPIELDSLSICHYKDDIFLVSIGLSLYAVRHNYILDQISIKLTKNSQSFLKILSTNSLLHSEQEIFDRYYFELDTNKKPYKLIFQCVDSIQTKPPQYSAFFDVKQMGNRLIFFYQQVREKSKNQLYFWITISDCVDKSQKIKEILPEKLPLQEQTEQIDKRVQSICKIGFSQSEAYFQLWNRSPKTKRYYELLIATQDYNIIRQQLQLKFKSHSLLYQQISWVLKSALKMLKEKYKNKCSSQTLNHLAMCHFLSCKIQMFEKIKRHSSQDSSKDISISIQDYYYLNNMELHSQLFQLLSQLLTEEKPVEIKIQALLTQFSLIFRLNYCQILPKIIERFPNHLLKLFTKIPEILPIQIQTDDKYSIKNGIWGEIDLETTKQFLILEKMSNLESQSSIKEFISSKSFKVHQWNHHGAIIQSIEAIKATLTTYNTDFFFTLLYASLHLQKQKFINFKKAKQQLFIAQKKGFQLSSEGLSQEAINLLIQKIQSYSLLPLRLNKKFRFYSQLYKRFNNFYSTQRKSVISVVDFFSLTEDELFLLYFEKERAEKGIFILKRIKPIYEHSTEKGGEIFLNNMFWFFKTNQSSWSDLKIILNKFNNEKQDFHKQNQKIIDIIVKAIMEKVHIGTGDSNQVQLQEVIAYIQNLPVEVKESDLLFNMINIRELYQQEDILKKIKVNMSLRDIMDRGEQVIYKMIKHEIDRLQVMKLDNPKELRVYAYNIMFDINEKQLKIYLNKHINFPYKAFLMIVMQQQKFIPLCENIIEDEYLKQAFEVTEELMQNIVIYLYRYKLYLNPIYSHNKQYIKLLVELLNPTSNKAKFIVLSEAFAKIFSLFKFHIHYPFFQGYYPSVSEIQIIVNSLNKEEINEVDYKKLFDVTYMLKMLAENYENIKDIKNTVNIQSRKERKKQLKYEIFLVFFIKFHQEGLFEKALEIAKLIVGIKSKAKRISDIILPIFLIETLQKELLNSLQKPIAKLISYYFHFPEELLNFVNYLINSKNQFSNQDIQNLINKKIKIKENQLIYDPYNQVFSEAFRDVIRGMSIEKQNKVINPLMETIWKQITERREQFAKNPIYSIMFRILLHDPLTLAQYIYRKHSGINVKSLRALITLLAFESIFSMESLFQVGRSIFQVVMIKLMAKSGSENEQKQDFIYSEQYIKEQTKLTAKDLVGHSITIMKEKSQILAKYPNIEKKKTDKIVEIQEAISQPNYYLQTKAKISYHLLQRLYPQKCPKTKKKQILQQELLKSEHLRYPFDDEDLQYTQTKYDLSTPFITYQPGKINFNEVNERSQKLAHLVYSSLQTNEKYNAYLNNDAISQFQQLYARIVQQKIQKYNPNSHISHKRSIQIDLKVNLTPDDEDDQVYFRSIFQSKCKEGGFLSLLKKPKLPNLLNAYTIIPSILGKPLEESIISQGNPQQIEKYERQLLNRQISLHFQQGKPFNMSLLPNIQLPLSGAQFFKEITEQIYKSEEYDLAQRVQLIWNIKKHLFGEKSISNIAFSTTKKLCNSETVPNVVTPIEQIFSIDIFTQNLDLTSIQQLLKNNIKEHVNFSQDYIKIASILREIFNSPSLEQEILTMFMITCCQKIGLEMNKNNRPLITELFLIMSRIRPDKLDQCIEEYSSSTNEYFQKIAQRLLLFRTHSTAEQIQHQLQQSSQFAEI